MTQVISQEVREKITLDSGWSRTKPLSFSLNPCWRDRKVDIVTANLDTATAKPDLVTVVMQSQ